MRLMGPNGIGVIDTHTPLNTTFVKGMPPKGQIAFLSQSGALCGGIIDWTVGRGIGFSRFLSVGNEADVNETDVIPVLAADEATRVITLYLEDVKGGPAFVDALAAAAAAKPVLALKAGRTAGGQAATASHTGALAGVHTAFRAACRQTGVIEFENIEAMFNAALALAYQPLPRGNRICLLTNAGGPSALAADALEAAGLQLARTSPATQALLRDRTTGLHPDAGVAGPVDLLGGADEGQYRRALDAVLADPAVDGVLAILVPQALVNAVAVVEAFAAAAGAQPAPAKPVLACLMGEASLDAAYRTAHAGRIPAYTFPEDAVAAFGALWRRAALDSTNRPATILWIEPTSHDPMDRTNQPTLDTTRKSPARSPNRAPPGESSGQARPRCGRDAALVSGLWHRHACRGPGDQPVRHGPLRPRDRLSRRAQAHQPRHLAQNRHRRRDLERAG